MVTDWYAVRVLIDGIVFVQGSDESDAEDRATEAVYDGWHQLNSVQTIAQKLRAEPYEDADTGLLTTDEPFDE